MSNASVATESTNRYGAAGRFGVTIRLMDK